jgi:PIN domain nuclease of toxin-antitoxin system
MRILLDTHALLWWLLDDPRLTERARAMIAAAGNEVLVSSASGFEIATKHRLGKLWTGRIEPIGLERIIAEEGVQVLPISLAHALHAGLLAVPHRDPFDRLLMAQSRLEGLPLVTVDPVFAENGIEVVW